MDVAPAQVFNSNGIRVYQNFMSGDWAWEEVVSSIFFFVLIFVKVYLACTRVRY